MALSDSISALHAAALGRPAGRADALASLQAELGELSGSPPPWPTEDTIPINPQTIAGSAQVLACSLLNADAFITQLPQAVFTRYGGVSGGAGVAGFSPASDLVQVQATQYASLASVQLHALDSAGTFLALGGGALTGLQGAPLASLHASSFRSD